jgi:ERCC4-type nuclease
MIIDYREKELIAELPSEPVKNLPVGDIWIGVDEAQEPTEGSILIERKTVHDFEASFLDGRYREQRTRLISYAAEKKANILYILEGDLATARTLKPEALQQLLNRLQLRYKIALINTSSVQHTAVICSLLEKQISEDAKCFIYEAVGYEQTIHVKKKDNTSDPKYVYLAMVQQISGISKNVAEALHSSYSSIPKLCAATEEELAVIKVGARKLGPKLAAKIRAAFTVECLN